MDDFPDGFNPKKNLEKWFPWIRDCLRMLDGDGTFAHYPINVVYYENPAYHMEVLDVIRYAWNSLKNEEIKNANKKKRRNKY